MKIKNHIPNSLTLLNMYCGFLSIGFSIKNQYLIAGLLILLGVILDAFDGVLARVLKVNSSIGAQLDSLSDLVTFGVAPSILFSVTHHFYSDTTIFALLGIFLLSGGYRLARFNSEKNKDISIFNGLPITAAGGILTLFSIFFNNINLSLTIMIILILSYLMISKIKIPRFSKIIHFNKEQSEQ